MPSARAVARPFRQGRLHGLYLQAVTRPSPQALVDELKAAGPWRAARRSASMPARKPRFQKLFAGRRRQISGRLRSACSTPDQTSTNPYWTPPKKTVLQGLGTGVLRPDSWSAAKPLA